MKAIKSTKQIQTTEHITKYACDVCGQEFDSVYSAAQHERVHYYDRFKYIHHNDKDLYFINDLESGKKFLKTLDYGGDYGGMIDWVGPDWYYFHTTEEQGSYQSTYYVTDLLPLKKEIDSLENKLKELKDLYANS